MGKLIGILVAIAVVVALLFVFGVIDMDADVEGGSVPEVEVQGELSAPDVDVDVEGPDVDFDGGALPEVEVEGGEMPSMDIDPADEADAEAEDDDPNN